MALTNGNGNGGGPKFSWAALVAVLALGAFIVQSLSLSAEVGRKSEKLTNAEQRILQLESDVRVLLLKRGEVAPILQNHDLRRFDP